MFINTPTKRNPEIETILNTIRKLGGEGAINNVYLAVHAIIDDYGRLPSRLDKENKDPAYTGLYVEDVVPVVVKTEDGVYAGYRRLDVPSKANEYEHEIPVFDFAPYFSH